MISERPKPRRRNAGLTLMELLISLALLALIALGITSSLGLALRIHDRSEELVPLSDPVIYRLHLRHWLTNAISPSLLTPFPSRFEGTGNSLEFVTLAETPYFPQAAAMRVNIVAREDDLILSVTALADDGSELDTTEKALAGNVANIGFSYLDHDLGIMDWQTEWQSEPTLPRAVKITADPGSRPDWPDFIVRLVFAPPA